MENKNLAKLLPVNFEGEQPTVSGRELHAALEIKTPYHIWFPRMCEYGFTENEDYTLVEQKCTTNNPKNPYTVITDHLLTIPMAKELCMLQRNDKGKMFRKYFIKIEEMWNSPEMITKRALQIADARIKQLTATVTDLHNDIDCLTGEVSCLNRELTFKDKVIEQSQPKVEFYNAVADTKDCIRVKEFAKLCHKSGISIGQNKLYKWFRDNKYITTHNEPYQQYVNAGYFIVREYHFFVGNEPRVSLTPYITGKGQQYFLRKLKEAFASA